MQSQARLYAALRMPIVSGLKTVGLPQRQY